MIRFESFINIVLTLAIILTGLYCAGQIPPSGGPPDTTPPSIIETYPKGKQLKFKDNKFFFSFNKYIDRRSFQESFFLSPPLGNLDFEWDGKEVEIHFSDSLLANTTYIITIGTDVKDTRNNRLASAFTLPFSTGEGIDSGLISGAVIDEKTEGIMIFAYPIVPGLMDTLNPSKTIPKYLTQTGNDGTFILPYLASGTYRLIAVRDQYKNYLYDPQVDDFGVLNSDVEINSNKQINSSVKFFMSIEDTAKPFLSSARALDNIHVLLRFSEPIDIKSLSIDNISVTDTLSNDKLKVLDVSFTERTYREVQIVTGEQIIGRTYRVKVLGCTDNYSNAISPSLNAVDFTAGIESDSTVPTFEILNLKSNSNNVAVNDSIHIFFNEAIQRKTFEKGFEIQDLAKTKISGLYKWISSAEVYFIPQTSLLFGMSYSLSINLDSVKDFIGNSRKDSVFRLKFRTIEEKLLSGLSGKIVDEVNCGYENIKIIANNVLKKDSKSHIKNVDSLGNFEFNNLEEGKYQLIGFYDKDKNGFYSFGKPFPFIESEIFSIYPDTLKLRARWPIEGIIIHLK